MSERLAIIGVGNMGAAVLRGALAAGFLKPQDVLAVEPDERRAAEARALGCAIARGPAEARTWGSILLAVKPQQFPAVADALRPLDESMLVISIMAGLGTERIQSALGGRARLVRVMPNLACQVGAGMSAIALGAGARPGDQALAERLFDTLGKTVIVREPLMHAVTAVSGSGPAYVFLLAEAMQQAAVEIGLNEADAATLVLQTIAGAARLLETGKRGAAGWRETVTSRGGTTEAALESLANAGFAAAIAAAIRAARDRGEALSRSG